MRIAAIVLTLICAAWAAAAFGAPPKFDPVRLSAAAPDQFYTNGKMINAWNRDEARNQLVTFWFGKNPKNSLSYQELIAVQEINGSKIYYYEVVDRVYVGRYDMKQGGYSMLSRENRKSQLAQIKESWFPPPGETPQIHELLPPLAAGEPKNTDRLMPPPPTMMFPRLKKSSWSGFYTDVSRKTRRTKMTLTLNGSRGRFHGGEKAPRGIDGLLRDVKYERADGMIMIRGRWSTDPGRSRRAPVGGRFLFRVMMMDLNSFRGEYTLDGDDRRFIWDGKRTSP